jgi:hypothetical protein
LIFDEFAALKFHVRNRIDNSRRQTARLEHLWKLRTDIDFADMHRRRAA